MSVAWPAALPMPQFGMRYNVADPQMRTLMASGRTISRRRFSDVPTDFQARWILTTAEAIEFDRFYQDDMIDGTEWAKMPLVTAEGQTLNFVRFRGGYSSRKIGPGLWEYTANMQMYLRPASGAAPPVNIYIPGDAPPGTLVFDEPQNYWQILPNLDGYDYGYNAEQGIWYAIRTSRSASSNAVFFSSLPPYGVLRPAYFVVEIEFIGADLSQSISNSVRPDAALGGVANWHQPNSPGRDVFVFPSSQATGAIRTLSMYKFYAAEIGDGFIIHFAGYIP